PLNAIADETDALSRVADILDPKRDLLNFDLRFVVGCNENVNVESDESFHFTFSLTHVQSEHGRRHDEIFWVGILSTVAETTFFDGTPKGDFTVHAIASVVDINQMFPIFRGVKTARTIACGSRMLFAVVARSNMSDGRHPQSAVERLERAVSVPMPSTIRRKRRDVIGNLHLSTNGHQFWNLNWLDRDVHGFEFGFGGDGRQRSGRFDGVNQDSADGFTNVAHEGS